MPTTFVDDYGRVTETETPAEKRQAELRTAEGQKKLYEQTKLYQQGKLDTAQIRDMQETFKALGAQFETTAPNGSKETKTVEVTGKKDNVTDGIASGFAKIYQEKHPAAVPAASQTAPAQSSAAPAKAPAPKPAEPKVLSPDELKRQEANAYLRVLGVKGLDEFRADNLLHGGADLKGKELTSPEVLAALKARVTGSEEAQTFARQMLNNYATTDRKPSQNLTGQDVVALQYMLKANGQDIGTFGPGKNGIDGILGDYTRKASETVAGPGFTQKPGVASEPKKDPPSGAQMPAPAASAGQQPTQQQQQPAPMTAQPPAGAALQQYPQPSSPPQTQMGERGTLAPVFTGQAAGGVVTRDPATNVAYNPYTGRYQYTNPNTGHFLDPVDRNRDGAIDQREYTAAVNSDNLRTNGTYVTGGNVRGMQPVLSQWTNGFPDVRERAYGRQDGAMTQRYVYTGYNNASRGIGALFDNNKANNGQGIGMLINGALQVFDPFGQQAPRGPRF